MQRKEWRKFPHRSMLFARDANVNTNTETLTITLPVELMERVRKLVSKGAFASEQEAILAAVQEASQWSHVPYGSHISLESLVGDIPEQVAQLEQDEEPV